MTQNEVAQGILSRSHLSDLENSDYYCSYDKFLNILNRLNVSILDFEYYLNNSVFYEAENIYKEITNFLNTNDLSFIKKNALFYLNKLAEINTLRSKHTILTIKAIIEYREHGYVINDYSELTNYLIKVNDWTSYELKLLNNTLFIYDADAMDTLGSKLIKKTKKNMQYTEIYVKLLINLSDYYIKHSNFSKALIYSKEAEKEAFKRNLLFEKILASINSLISISYIDKKIAPKLNDYIQILYELDYKGLSKSFQKQVTKIERHIAKEQNT